MIDRRQFLGSLAAVVGTAFAGNVASAATDADRQAVRDLVDQMTTEEKVQFTYGHDGPATGNIPGLSRLDIPSVQMADGPVGVRAGEATAFPATIAAAASFDRDLVYETGATMGVECKAKNQDALLAPALNIDRVPVNGRTFEYYSEDPYVSGELAAEMAQGIQDEGIVACAKHFVANNQEIDRMSVSANVSERALREIYFPGFKKTIQEGGALSVMGAYNRVNGTYCTQNAFLLEDVLKGEWGFEGYELSDWGATHSTATAANTGHDLDMYGGQFENGLLTAVQNGDVPESRLDDMVERFLLAYKVTGHLDGEKAGSAGAQNTTAHQTLARETAEQGAVLLKNENDVLPLDTTAIDSLAVVGSGVESAVVGGGGSSDVTPPYSVDPLSAIESYVGDDVTVTHESGETSFTTVPSSVLTPPSGSGDGLQGEYFDNQNWSGTPVTTQVDAQVDTTDTDVAAATAVSENDFSVRWSGTITVPDDGFYAFELSSDDGSFLSIDGEQVIDNGGAHAVESVVGAVELTAGDHDITVEWFEAEGGAQITLSWAAPGETTGIDRTRQAAADADAALVFGQGSSTEGWDRSNMVLDGIQNALIDAAASANANTAAVLRTGGPIEMPWVDDVPAILQLWYPGMEDGNATANVVFGDTNPGGKLPITFGRSFDDYPADETHEYPGVNGQADYTEGVFVGYRWFDQRAIEPLFPFGHGESYTDFAYANVQVPDSTTPDSTATVTVDVTNTGDRAGSEVVQLYVQDLDASVQRPPKELADFAKPTLAAGETTTVSLELDRESFQFWDPATGEWTVEDGDFQVLVAASSRDIRGQGTITVSGDGDGGSDTTAPSDPSNVSVTGSTTSSLTVDWDAAGDAGGSGLARYDVALDGTNVQQIPAGTTTATLDGLATDTEYTVGVTAVNGAGNASATVTVTGDTAADTTPPAAPTNLASPARTDTTVDLSWDAVGASDLDHYVVSLDGSQEQTVSAGTTTATVSGLSADTTYTLGVAAVDDAGNASSETTVSVSTDAASGGSVVWAVNAGGDAYTAASGTAFAADADFSGGTTAATGDAISGTEDDALYQSERYGSFSYDVPVSSGTYDLDLHFAETYWTSDGARVFDVIVNGSTVRSSLDVHSRVGHDAALVETVTGVSPSDGTITVEFVPTVDNATVSAISVTAADGSGSDDGSGGSADLPQTVSSVDYTASQGDFSTESNGRGGQSIGYIDGGDWWEYDAPVDTDATVDIVLAVSSPYDGTAVRVEVDGTDVSGTVEVPNSGAWQNWTDVTAATGVSVDADSTIRVVAESNGWNYDAVRLE